ncbi:hypothetical protein GGR23_002649 [Gellertiella hungarica]|uniref:Uncharacterized protein n=1 Tax=Gellertiella hungarica TaxID=1572859 RepID=A0A7W6J7S1_9HYPH|nr:hypothetical protein [Gellertiella hungarica]
MGCSYATAHSGAGAERIAAVWGFDPARVAGLA